MSGKDPDDVRAIVNTLLVPMDPPNRSQWRKLELAMEFIKKSKNSAGGEFSEHGTVPGSGRMHTEKNEQFKEKMVEKEAANDETEDQPDTVNIGDKKVRSWSKIKHSFKHIL